ncbi:hypothetical protein C4D60_Mb09t05190 [Musa balbisiana]|uniref:Uncharacterized protein n=1 Tax=Musa balbisiana TaxID=52838 RepID=A0A4S8IE79_MUSBA|nr:hypothetical protein C4D60_Mb09t05190 [Musa balbisiana]
MELVQTGHSSSSWTLVAGATTAAPWGLKDERWGREGFKDLVPSPPVALSALQNQPGKGGDQRKGSAF